MYHGPTFSLENLIVCRECKLYGTNWVWFGVWFWPFLHADVQFLAIFQSSMMANDATQPHNLFITLFATSVIDYRVTLWQILKWNDGTSYELAWIALLEVSQKSANVQ